MRPLIEDPRAWQGALDVPAALRPFQQSSLAGLSAPAGDALPAAPVDLWLGYLLPSYNQHGPSCVGHGWANWIEAMVRRYVSASAFRPGEQMDGEAIWKRGREMFFGGDMTGGLYLPQGMAAAVSLGFLPASSRAVKVAQTWDAICAALLKTPIVQGHVINAGWFRESRESGCIDHDARPDNTGAHATLLAATLCHADTAGAPRQWVAFLNSWGAERGRYGVYLMTWEEWKEQVMWDAPYTAAGVDWRTWRGWEKGVVRKS